MTTTRRLFSLSLALMLVISMLSFFAFPASAASGASKKYGVFQTKTMTITTNKKGNPSITFKSYADSYRYNSKAPILSLKVYNHSTKSTQYYRVTGPRYFGDSVSSKLKLNVNTTYTVTVSYLYDKSLNWGTHGTGDYKTTGWYDGLWKITATKNLSYKIK